MAERIKQIAITYLTHRWVMAGIAAWVVLIATPQIVAPASDRHGAQRRAAAAHRRASQVQNRLRPFLARR